MAAASAAPGGESVEIASYELSPEHEQILNKTFLLLQKKGTKKKNELDERQVYVYSIDRLDVTSLKRFSFSLFIWLVLSCEKTSGMFPCS